MASAKLRWQSKLVLLLVLPAVASGLVLQAQWWLHQSLSLATWTLGLSALLGLITWKLRAASPAAALAGAAITASLMFSTVVFPYEPWHTALIPVLAVSLLAAATTRLGRGTKQRMGLAEHASGRTAAQVCANLGLAALVSGEFVQGWLLNQPRLDHPAAPLPLFAVALAALAEAAADTVSSEVGQVFGGVPRMITSFRRAEPGADGAITAVGTLTGILAAALVSIAGAWAFHGGRPMVLIAFAGGVCGLFVDSFLGATFERLGWLNNDLVNFLSTASASACAVCALAFLPSTSVL